MSEIDYISRALWREYDRHVHGPECINRDDSDDTCTETRILESEAQKRDNPEKPLEPNWQDGVEHVYDVKVSVAVGLMFDEPPEERDLRIAMLENVIDKLTSAYTFDVDYDDDITYELLAVEDGHLEDKE